MKKYRVLKDFPAKRMIVRKGDIIERIVDHVLTKLLVNEGYIKPINEWSPAGVIESKLARVLIATNNYSENGKDHFNFDEALEIKGKLNNGWRLPTRREWALICEEFGCDETGRLNGELLKNNISLPYSGFVVSGQLSLVNRNGYYWSSTAKEPNDAYNLSFSSSGVIPFCHDLRFIKNSVRLVKDIEK